MDVEVTMLAEAEGMLWVVTLPGGGEKRQIPILCHVPVEGVEGVEENEQEPVNSQLWENIAVAGHNLPQPK